MPEKPTVSDEATRELTLKLADRGNLIGAGFVGLARACGLAAAPPAQIHDMRLAFFAGAQHTFASIITILMGDGKPDTKVTDEDLARIRNVEKELNSFIEEFESRFGKPHSNS